MRRCLLIGAVNLLMAAKFLSGACSAVAANERLRVIVETDLGGDPDDEQSLVRLLCYANEWDVEGIICNRAAARDGENLNSERTGLGIGRRLVSAYGKCYPNLAKHDARYPRPDKLLQRTVSGYEESDDGVKLILAAADANDSRPIWFLNWGTVQGAASSSLKRALDDVLAERGVEGYAAFKDRFRLCSDDQFGDHTLRIDPPFKLWVDALHPELDGKRWYHRFSVLTATAGGFDLTRDVLTGHGPLGAMYPTNTTLVQKEGDTMTFLYLVPTGMNDPDQPTWGSWAGRYGQNEKLADRPYYWANQVDEWNGSRHRDNCLKRWAVHLQNDFAARMDWCVNDFAGANHPPAVHLKSPRPRVKSGETVTMDASGSRDADGNQFSFAWAFYPEVGTYKGRLPPLRDEGTAHASFVAPMVESEQTIHLIATVTDDGSPPLTRYGRAIVTVFP